MRSPRRSLALAIAALPLLSGCADEPEPIPSPPGYSPPPPSEIVEQGAVTIRREVFTVKGVTPPANPDVAMGGETPEELNAVRVVRYRVEATPPKPARAIAIMMPGYLGGAGNFDSIARALVRRSSGADVFEAWAIDRRGNLLEDHHGLDVAEVKKDPTEANRYYFEGQTVEGETFTSFVQQYDLAFASEWGITTTIGDMREVVKLVDPSARRDRVVLLGHSMGAPIVEEYAAWDFDGARGHDEIAGLVLVDGIGGHEGEAMPPSDEATYKAGNGGGFLSQPGLDAIRSSQRTLELPILGLGFFAIADVAAMRASWKPDEVSEDPYRDQAMLTLLALGQVPKMTNRAFMGFALDDASNGVAASAVVKCGASAGGPVETYQSIGGGMVVHPSDPNATYTWVEFDEVNPREYSSLDDVAPAWFRGPGLDFTEWYFPHRLPLDTGLASTLVMGPGSYPYDTYGMRAVHGATIDVPIMVSMSTRDPASADKLRALLANVPVGQGRPLAGTLHADDKAFQVRDLKGLSHIDIIAGSDTGAGIVQGWYDDLAAFLITCTPSGGVSVPIQE